MEEFNQELYETIKNKMFIPWWEGGKLEALSEQISAQEKIIAKLLTLLVSSNIMTEDEAKKVAEPDSWGTWDDEEDDEDEEDDLYDDADDDE